MTTSKRGPQDEIGYYLPSSGIVSATKELTNERFTIAQEFATATFDEAIVLLEELGESASDIKAIGVDVDINQETLNLGSLLSAGKPVMGAVPGFAGLVVPNAPDVPDIIITDLKSIPSFDVVKPVLNIPAAPVYAEPTEPGDAPPIQPINVPGAPDIVLPVIPTFNAITLPTAPEISIPDFDEVAPIDDLQLPDKLTVYDPGEEAPYQSDLLDKIKEFLLEKITTPGTGMIESGIEADIYERENERRTTLLEESKEDTADEWSSRGAPLPPGVLIDASLKLTIAHDQNRLDRAREVSTQQVELAQKFLMFCIEKGLTLEDSLMRLFNDVLNRAFDIAKYVNEVALLYFQAQVSLFNTRLEGYKAKASIYEIRIRAALVELDIYKGELEGANLQLQANSEEVKLYIAQIQGVNALISLYTAEIENAKTEAELNKLNLDAYKTKVDAYTARIGALTARYQMYQAQLSGEATKADIYSTEVEAYKKRVDAASIEERLNIEKAQAEADVLAKKIDLFRAEITKYVSEVDARSTETNAIIEEFKGETQAYLADSQASNVLIQSEINQFQARISQSNNNTQIALKQAEITIREAIETNALKIESIKAAATISAQIGASALSGVTASASLSVKDNTSAQVTQSYDESYSVRKEID